MAVNHGHVQAFEKKDGGYGHDTTVYIFCFKKWPLLLFACVFSIWIGIWLDLAHSAAVFTYSPYV